MIALQRFLLSIHQGQSALARTTNYSLFCIKHQDIPSISLAVGSATLFYYFGITKFHLSRQKTEIN